MQYAPGHLHALLRAAPITLEQTAKTQSRGVGLGATLPRCLGHVCTRIFIFRFRFQDDQRLAVVAQQQKIDESLCACLKVRTETFDVVRLQLDVRLKNDIRGTALEAPASGLQQPIDFDPRRRFLA